MSTRIPQTKSTVSYAYTVKGKTGNIIGNLQGFNPSANRALDRIRELNGAAGDVDTVEIVPGRMDLQITIDRFETFDESLSNALRGPNQPLDLSKQTEPFTITETVRDSVGNTRSIFYIDCWIQNWSKTIREGTITVAENVTVYPTRITNT